MLIRRLVLLERGLLGHGGDGEGEGAEDLTHPAAADRASPVLGTAIPYLLRHWPSGFHSNTPKEVLLLHEVGRQGVIWDDVYYAVCE